MRKNTLRFLVTFVTVILSFSHASAQVPAQTSPFSPQSQKSQPKIPILEYHHIDPKPSRWGRSVQEFKDDLLWLYNNGYVSFSMEDFADSNFSGIPAGKKPVVLTFDDGLISQFQYLKDGSIDPDSAIGILDQFSAEHPDFGKAAIFYVNANPFGQKDFVQKKIQYLFDTGRQIGYHTLEHTNMTKLQPEGVQKILQAQTAALKPLLPLGMRLDSLAYPFGGVQKSSEKVFHWDSKEGTDYDITSALLVGADPALPLNVPGADPYRIPRIQAIDSEFLRHFGRKPGETAAGTSHEIFVPFVGSGIGVGFAAMTSSTLQTQQSAQVSSQQMNGYATQQNGQILVFDFNLAQTWNLTVGNPVVAKVYRRMVIHAVKALTPNYKGVYLTAYAAGSQMGQDIMKKAKDAGANLVVFDMKEVDGHLFFPSTNQINKAAGGNDRILLKDPKTFIAEGKKMGFHMVARVACFKDELMAVKKPEWAIHNFNGGIWKSPEGQVWLDPSLPEVQDYVISVAKEAASFGVDEIQFDYVRFPTQGRVGEANYTFDEKKTQHYEIIRDFLKKARKELAPMGVKIGVDLFGVVVWNHEYDAGSTGQKIGELAPYIDVVYPMIYPSHFGHGFAGYKKPGDEPYFFVHESVRLFQELLVDYPVVIRPWFQAFPYRVSNYNGVYVQKQADAAHDLGVDSFVLWNAGNNYDVAWGVFGKK